MSFANFPKSLEQVANNTFTNSEKLLIQNLGEAHEVFPNHATGLIYCAGLHAAAALNYIARAIASGETSQEKSDNATKETMLVAALLVARMAIPQKDGIKVEFSPRNVLASLEVAKSICGNPLIEEMFDKNMVQLFREGCEERHLTYGYWDYLEDVGPDFDGFSAGMSNFTKH